jgi:hypothetical protein
MSSQSVDSITIIVPTRHRPDFVAVAARSIQTSAAELMRARGVPTRVLVVDDAPDNDETEQMARTLGVDYLKVPEHDGLRDPGAAIVLGVQNVDTQYQAVFGDDDVMLPRHLVAAVDKLEQGFDVVSCSFQVGDLSLRPYYKTVILEQTCLGDLIAGHTTVNDGSLVPHDLVKGLDWDVTLLGQMLVPIWGELMLAGHTFGVVEEPTWIYRRHGANLSSGALSVEDRELRAAVRARLAERAMEVLGHIPPSTRQLRVEEEEAAKRAEQEEAARLVAEAQREAVLSAQRNGRAIVPGEFAGRQRAFVRRGRNKLARLLTEASRAVAP